MSKLRPPQITTNKFGFVKENVSEKADSEQLEKQSKSLIPKEKDLHYKRELKEWEGMLGKPVSIGGVKQGILRYFGSTKFASGLWCGIELEEPVGKNNGIINGVQYFSCKENHGIFAPVSKVQCISELQSSSHYTKAYSIQSMDTVQKPLHRDQSEDERRTSTPKASSVNYDSRICSSNYFSFRKQKSAVCDNHSFVIEKDSNSNEEKRQNQTFSKLEEHAPICNDTFTEFESKETLSSHIIDKTYSSINSKIKLSEIDTNEKTDMNTTFTFEGASSNVTHVKDKEIMSSTFDVELSPINENISQTLNKQCSGKNTSLNATFFLEDACKMEEISTELKPKKSSDNDGDDDDDAQVVRKLSIKDTFDFDDFDDFEPPSLDESLGILTPNQMKDFSIDQQSIITFDSDTFRIPKIASCDDIDDIPEDEIKETLSQLNGSYNQILTEGNLELENQDYSSLSKTHLISKENITLLKNRNEIEKDVVNSRQASVPDVRNIIKTEFPLKSPLIDLSGFNCKDDFDSIISENQSKQAEITEKCLTKHLTEEKLIEFDKSNTDANNVKIDNKELPACSFIHNITLSSHNTTSGLEKLDKNLKLTGDALDKQEHASIDTQLCIETEKFIRLVVPDAKRERPASTYTVGSTDTGYQDDGDFDAQSEASAAIISPEFPAHSMCTSNRSMGTEDNEKHAIAEIMTDSDFFTDSGGLGCTESEMETDIECKLVSEFMVENNEICTIIEKSPKQWENDKNGTAKSFKQDYRLKEGRSFTLNETRDKDLPLNITRDIFVNDDTESKEIISDAKYTEIISNSKLEKVNSFIIAGKDETVIVSSVKEKSNVLPKQLSKNKTWIKTKEVPKNDNILQTRSQNEIIQNSEKKPPKKNAVSRIKLMLETPKTLSKNDENCQKMNRISKRSRWDDVTSKIAASLAEEKSKVKAKKEVKSRIDTNLLGAKQMPSRRPSQFDSTRTSISVENENITLIETAARKCKVFQKMSNQLSPTDLKTNERNVENSFDNKNSYIKISSKTEGYTQKTKKKQIHPVSSSHSLSSTEKSENSNMSVVSYNSHNSKLSSEMSRNCQFSQNTTDGKSFANPSKQNSSSVERRISSSKVLPSRAARKIAEKDDNVKATFKSGCKSTSQHIKEPCVYRKLRTGIPRHI